MIDLDASLFIQIVNFLVLIVVLNFVLYRPIRGILAKRAEKMAEIGSEIAASSEGVKTKNSELEALFAEGRAAGRAAKSDLLSQGKDKETELLKEATNEMEAAVAKVRAQIAEDIGAARESLKGEVRVFGQELAQKILGRSIQ